MNDIVIQIVHLQRIIVIVVHINCWCVYCVNNCS